MYYLIVVIAPLIIASIVVLMLLPSNDGNSMDPDPRPLSTHERKAKRLERRLEASPDNEKLWARAIEAWNRAGGQWLLNRDFGDKQVPAAVREDFSAAVGIWDHYLERKADEANAGIAEVAATIYMQLAEIGSRDPTKVEDYVASAARASEIAGRHHPILFTLSNTAVYAYFNGETARGEVAAEGAAADAHSKQLHRVAVDQLNEYQERGETFRRLLSEAKAELRESGDELLDEPLKAYVQRAGLNKDDPTK